MTTTKGSTLARKQLAKVGRLKMYFQCKSCKTPPKKSVCYGYAVAITNMGEEEGTPIQNEDVIMRYAIEDISTASAHNQYSACERIGGCNAIQSSGQVPSTYQSSRQ